MRFDERFLDELKSRLRLSDVIGRTVKLRRQGREFAGLSPFTQEKSPSFYVNDDKGFFHDFSSGKHGDLIDFLQETERLTFREAVERLSAEAGMALPALDPRAAAEEQKRQGLQDWLVLAARWFEAELMRPAGAAARAYLERRGLPEGEWARFGLGFAPNGRTALKDYLVAKGARPAELVESGLLIAPEDGGAPYDRFRDRIIFPITDARGRVVSFGGRAMDAEARAKYLNGPETPLFHKSFVLYGLPEARRLLHTGGEAAALVVVEGYMDVIACQRAGVAAVAPLGTALTEEQMAVLWRLHPEPTLSFDGDGAGLRAAHRTLDRALPLLKPGRTLRFAVVKGGKDPDEVLREQGAEALKSQLADTQPFIEVLFARERDAAQPLDTPERRTALKVRLRTLAAAIADADLSQSYRQALLDRFEALWALERPARTYDEAARAFRQGRGGRRTPAPSGPTPEGRAAARRLLRALRPSSAMLAAAVLNHPDFIDSQLEAMDVQGFGDRALDGLAKEIIRLRLSFPALDSQSLGRHLAHSGFSEVLAEIARASAGIRASFLQPDITEERARADWSLAYAQALHLAHLERAIDDAKSEADIDFEALITLKAERDGLKRRIKAGEFDSLSEGISGPH
jgi:DNA primase